MYVMKGCEFMNAGYVRLSKDDDKRNYSSIENQKLIITQFAAEMGEVIDHWYEDDGVSGYIFDRPGFNDLMADLEKDILIRRYFYEQKPKEIARALDLSVKQVDNYLYRSKQKLRHAVMA